MSSSSKIEVETTLLGPCRHKLSVRVPTARVDQEFEHYYKHVASRLKLPGFRPGKVPLSVVRKQMGETVVEEAAEHAIEHLMGDAIREAGLHPLRLVDFDPKQHPVVEGQELAFEVEIETAPKIELPPWEEVVIEPEATEPKPEQIAAAKESLGREHARFDANEGGALDDQHLAEGRLTYFRDGDEGPKAETLRLSLGSPLYGTDPERFAAALKGAKSGDVIELDCEFNEGFSEESWVGGSGTARFEVQRIVKPRPATPEEIAEDLSMENGVEELDTRIHAQLAHDNESAERERRIHEVLERIGRLRPFELPVRLVEEETEAALESHRKRLVEQAGVPEEEAAKKAEEVREQLAEDAHRRLRHYFLVRKVAEQEGIRPTERDLDAAFRALAARHGVDAKSVRAYYDEQDMTSRLQGDILEGKVRAFLAHKATKPEPEAPVVPASGSE
ncbi:MAG TPA: trigger factor [Planctomycetota bacterium]